ncbi:hypothetical protein [Nocardia panacis]|uniref:hypothetical protein n=1 Tax=Nocardia panacis TaxID=2340916 RepID=UPI00131581AB|nr:hypothetical protein [Nocardia panacis]
MNNHTLTRLGTLARGIILGLAVITVVDAIRDFTDWQNEATGQPNDAVDPTEDQ